MFHSAMLVPSWWDIPSSSPGIQECSARTAELVQHQKLNPSFSGKGAALEQLRFMRPHGKLPSDNVFTELRDTKSIQIKCRDVGQPCRELYNIIIMSLLSSPLVCSVKLKYQHFFTRKSLCFYCCAFIVILSMWEWLNFDCKYLFVAEWVNFCVFNITNSTWIWVLLSVSFLPGKKIYLLNVQGNKAFFCCHILYFMISFLKFSRVFFLEVS